MSSNLKYAVFGSGSWATAIVKMLCENESKIGWYMRSVYTKEHLLKHQHNPSYLSSVEFHLEQLNLSNDINEIADAADVLIFVIPSAFIHSELEKLNIDIYSILGQKMRSHRDVRESSSVKIGDLKDGIYYVVINEGHVKQWIRKIIKKS